MPIAETLRQAIPPLITIGMARKVAGSPISSRCKRCKFKARCQHGPGLLCEMQKESRNQGGANSFNKARHESIERQMFKMRDNCVQDSWQGLRVLMMPLKRQVLYCGFCFELNKANFQGKMAMSTYKGLTSKKLCSEGCYFPKQVRVKSNKQEKNSFKNLIVNILVSSLMNCIICLVAQTNLSRS